MIIDLDEDNSALEHFLSSFFSHCIFVICLLFACCMGTEIEKKVKLLARTA